MSAKDYEILNSVIESQLLAQREYTKQLENASKILKQWTNNLKSDVDHTAGATSSTKEKNADKKEKKIRDPNMPKKGKSAYLLWCGDNLDKFKVDFPNVNSKDIMKLMGNAWTALDENVKTSFNQRVEKEKADYEKKMALYNSVASNAPVFMSSAAVTSAAPAPATTIAPAAITVASSVPIIGDKKKKRREDGGSFDESDVPIDEVANGSLEKKKKKKKDKHRDADLPVNE